MIRSGLLAFFLGGLVLSAGVSGSIRVAAAGDCAALRAQIFGAGPNDRESAKFKYNNLKSALAKTKARLASDERDLDLTRRSEAAYFVHRGKVNAMLEFKLQNDTERVREDRVNERYYTQRLAAAASVLLRLNAEYRANHCGAQATPAAEPQDTWAGTWSSNYGEMKLDESGSGSYAFCNGRLSGSVSGNVASGTWKQDFPCGGALEATGDFKFTLAAGGKRWSGGWRYSKEPNVWRMGWSGTCVAGPCMENH